MSDWYDVTGNPGFRTDLTSAVIRAEFVAIAAAMAKLPSLAVANALVTVNSGGTALTTTAGGLVLGGDFTTLGAFDLTITLTGNTSVTFPTSGTLVSTTVATLSSLTTVGTLIGGATGAGFTIALGTSTVTGILGAANGGTASAFFAVSGPASTIKTFTLPNASATILTDAAAVTVAQGGTGRATATAYAVIIGGTTATGAHQSIASVGTAGQVLTSAGAGAPPAFQSGGGQVWLATLTANNDPTLSDITNITSTYSNYLIVFENLVPSTDGVLPGIRLAIAGTFQTANYSWGAISVDNAGTPNGDANASTDRIYLSNSAVENTAANGGVSGFLILSNPAGTSHWKRVTGQCSSAVSTAASVIVTDVITGAYNGAVSAINGIRFLFDSGNIATGKMHIYGIRTS